MYSPHSDGRSGRVVFVCHCLLNANAKVCGLAKYAGMQPELARLLAEENLGVIQLPCPEFMHLGPKRWWQVRSQYDTPAYRQLCLRIAQETADMIQQYKAAGYSIAGLLGVEGSPSCGVEKAYDSPVWGGKPETVNLSDCRVSGSGIFMETLKDVFADQMLDVPFAGLPSDAEGMLRRLARFFESTA